MLNGREKIEEILQRTNMVELVGKHVELRRVGRSFVGLCPFHGERTPSFHVYPEGGRFKCFGCDKGGDAIAFVMEMEAKDFPSTIRELAEQAGVPLAFDPREQQRIADRRELLRACQVAALYFEENLWGPKGAAGREHLERRGVSERVAREAGLGYAPAEWQGLCHRLRQEGIDDRRAVEAGLVVRKDNPRGEDDRQYDVFRGRLMVPIRDPDCRVIAFGGRIVEGDDPRKYINSRETPLYRKGRVLYGVDVAKAALRGSREVVLVEGYFDAIAMWQAEVMNTVALCSTSLTQDHLKLLERFGVEKLVLLLDGDRAGQEAAMRLAGPVLASGLSATVVTLPDGEDPDSFLISKGPEAYRELEKAAPRLSAHVLQRAVPDEGGYEDAMRALADLRQVVAALPEGVERTLFLAEISRTLRLQQREVESYFRESRQAPRESGSQEAPRQNRQAPSPPPSRRELEVVACLFAFPDLRTTLGKDVVLQLGDMDLREAAALLLSDGVPEEEILSRLSPALERSLAERVRQLGSQGQKDWEQEVRDGLLHLEMEKLRDDLRTAIGMRGDLERDLFAPGGSSRKDELLREVQSYGQHATKLREKLEGLRQQLRSAP